MLAVSQMIKRVFDVVTSFLLMLLISPVFLLIAVLVRCKLGSPILFHQIQGEQ